MAYPVAYPKFTLVEAGLRMLKSLKSLGSLCVAATLLAFPGLVRAQALPEGSREMATRSELEASLATAKGDERVSIQQRLSDGDFQAGDLIALSVIEESTLSDTFTVRAGRTLKLPNLPEIPLKGVLRSELRGFLAAKVAESVRNPQVDAIALIRVAVLGAVNRPGFYNVPAETPASQVVMIAGGPGANTNLKKVEVRRGEVVVLDRAAMSAAFAAGTSIDQLNVHGGDQIVVGERSQGWKGVLQTVGLIAGVLSSVYFGSQIF